MERAIKNVIVYFVGDFLAYKICGRGEYFRKQRDLNLASDPKIIKMRQGELNRIKENYKRKMAEIEKAKSRADIHSTHLVFGILEIEN